MAFETTEFYGPSSVKGVALSSSGREMIHLSLPELPACGYHAGGYPATFIDAIDAMIQRCRHHDSSGALLILSVDNLPMIMNAYGIAASEHAMREVEKSVRQTIGEQHICQRIQRDQFGILVTHSSLEELDALALELNSKIQHWCSHNEYGSIHVVHLLACTLLPQEASNADEALSKCYLALHDRSAAVGDLRHYKDRQEEAAFSRQEMSLANYLNQAIVNNRLLLAYQPIVCSRTGHIHHYEALLRIRGDDGKISSAGALIPIAERMGLIALIDELTFQMAVKEVREHPDLHLAFNISNITTQNDNWLDLFTRTIAETPEIAPRLTVEITETAVQKDLHYTAYFVAEIQSTGALVALDDFGSGYTSFRQLKTLSVDMVKIDGAFIKDLVENADNQFFVKTLLDFTNGFGLQSVAEFVENGEIAKMLMELGVQMLQGYYLGRPELDRPWLKQASKPRLISGE